MPARLTLAIKFVADMEMAVRFHRDVLGLELKFQSPYWSEFAAGEINLALHPASQQNPPGTIQLGFRTPDLDAFYQDLSARGVKFTRPPEAEGSTRVARFLDQDGVESSVSGEA